MRNSRYSLGLISALACAPLAGEAWGGQLIILPGATSVAYGDVTGGLFTTPISGTLTPIRTGGRTYLKAFSVQTNPQIGPNPPAGVTTMLNGAAGPAARRVAASATGTYIPVPKGGGAKGYNFLGPVVALPNQRKGLISAPGNSEYITSTSGPYTGAGGQFNVGGKLYTAAGAANTQPFGLAPAGAAAGSAYDPEVVTPGTTYGYAPEIDVTLNLSAAEGGNETGGVHLYAVDSNSDSDVEHFDADGEPDSGTLWSLDVSDDSAGDPVVDFELDPANPADAEITFAVPYLQSVDPADCDTDTNCQADHTASVDADIDQSEDAAIMAELVADAGVLTDFSIFGTMNGTDDASYTPEALAGGGNVAYGDGVDAGLEVPEPGTLSLFVVGLAGIALRRRRARQV